MSKEYLTDAYRLALLDYVLGKPGAIDVLARITMTATMLYGVGFADSLVKTQKGILP